MTIVLIKNFHGQTCQFMHNLAGLSMEMGFSWEFHGKCPMGWDGTARIAFPMEPMGQ